MKTKNILVSIVFILSLCPALSLKAQQNSEGLFSKGDNIIGLGVGLGGSYDYGITTGYSQTPSIQLTYENATIDNGGNVGVGFGGYLSYFTSRNNWTDGNYSYSDQYTFEFVMARAALHYKVRYSFKIDPYLGITAGYAIAQHDLVTQDPNVKYNYDPGYTAYVAEPANSGTLQYGAYIGARYYFGDRFGIWAELVVMNNAYNYIGLGINFKF